MSWLDMVVHLFCCMVEAFLLYDFFGNFFTVKINDKYIKIMCIGTAGAIYLVNLLESTVLNLMLVPMLLWLFVSVVFEAGLAIRFVYFVIAYIVMSGVEFLCAVLNNITKASLAETGLIPVSEYLWQVLLIKFLNYIVFIIIKQMSAKAKNKMTDRLFMVYLCVPISSLGMMVSVFYSGIDVTRSEGLKILMTLLWGCMVAGNMLLFYAFQRYAENLNENEIQRAELTRQKAEVERLMKIAEWNDNYKEAVHNTNHYLKVIGHLANESKNDEICKIVEELNGKLNREAVFEYCNDKMLNIILSEYSAKAGSAGIAFDAYVEPGCTFGEIQDVDFVAIFGNLMDNAVLAASKKKEKPFVSVRVFMQREGEICVIKIVNNFAEKPREIGGRLISTKREAGIHGIGLASVERAAAQYHGYLEHYIKDEKFHVVVVLPVI